MNYYFFFELNSNKRNDIQNPKRNAVSKAKELDRVTQMKNAMVEKNYSKKVDLEGLRKKLEKYRMSKCRQNDVPEQYIFTDSELEVLIEKRPKAVNELTRRKLLTPVKIRMFGEDIVNIIKSFEE